MSEQFIADTMNTTLFLLGVIIGYVIGFTVSAKQSKDAVDSWKKAADEWESLYQKEKTQQYLKKR